ncbi:MAG: type VII secretion integral membrane protein EccD [Actinomycetia bacterium]|nr:type VII secretion integral membrane protein EccD [Actinomycetes bacterium]
MPDTLCRLAFHVPETAGADTPPTADLLLPPDYPVAELIPPIVDVLMHGPARATDPLSWSLTRIGGQPIDTSMTLRENAVYDGDLILLTRASAPAPLRRTGDSSSVVTGLTVRHPAAVLHSVGTAVGVAGTLVGAVALGWTGGIVGSTTHLWTAAALSVASATGAVATGRLTPRMSLVLSVAAVAFAIVTGILVGRDASAMHAFFFAASCGFTVSVLLLHRISDNTETLYALAAFTGATAAAGLIGMTADLLFGAAGATLTVLSLAALSLAPKLTVAASGLGPSRPEIEDRRAAIGHRVLTGLIAGWLSSTMLGVWAVALGGIPGAVPWGVSITCAANVGLLLLLRQRTHIDIRRRIMLGAAGLSALTAAIAAALRAVPEHSSWLCVAAVSASVIAVRSGGSSEPPSPVVRQALQVLEYLALAAVIPLAAWVTGIYGLVRGLSLS